jgi:hypothetical protein
MIRGVRMTGYLTEFLYSDRVKNIVDSYTKCTKNRTVSETDKMFLTIAVNLSKLLIKLTYISE